MLDSTYMTSVMQTVAQNQYNERIQTEKGIQKDHMMKGKERNGKDWEHYKGTTLSQT